MLRRDREIKDAAEIAKVLQKCDTVRIGIGGGEYPYVVPVSFGVVYENGQFDVYFHCAKLGLKIELLNSNPKVCVEGDIYYGVHTHEHGMTTMYESVIGFGTARVAEDEDKVKGLNAIVGHYGFDEYPVENCRSFKGTRVYKITLDSVTGKRYKPV